MAWNRGVGHSRREKNTKQGEAQRQNKDMQTGIAGTLESSVCKAGSGGAQEHTGLGRRIWTAMGYYSRSQDRKVKEECEGILQTSGLC